MTYLKKSNSILHGVDRHGNSFDLSYEGTDVEELAHFGGLDLHINVVKYMISETLSPMDFPEKEGDFLIGDKVAALYLNEIGDFYRHCHSNPDAWEGFSNLQIVQYFLNEQLGSKEVMDVIEKDNKLKKEEENRDSIGFQF